MKKSIPTLAAGTALALSGCGNADKTALDLEVAISELCLKSGECYPQSDIGDCVSTYVAAATYQRENLPGCEGVVASYWECAAALDCADFVGETFAGCEPILQTPCGE